MNSEEDDFEYYPNITDDDFYEKIYHKKEFYDSKSKKLDKPQTIEEICNPKAFNVQHYQEFIRNFISSDTSYKGILAFWGVGVGKCLHPDTIIEIFDEKFIKMSIKTLWSTYRTHIFIDKEGGFWTIPSKPIYIKSTNINDMNDVNYINDTNDMNKPFNKRPNITLKKITQLYSLGVTADLISIKINQIDNKESYTIVGTSAHKICTLKNTWKTLEELHVGDCLLNVYSSRHFMSNVVVEKQSVFHNGLVYDIEVDDTHTYLIESLLSHNTCGAIQITEGLKDEVNKNGGKIYILSNKQLKPNFLKELYSFDREKGEKMPGSKQCTGTTYYLDPNEFATEESRAKEIRKKIKKTYEFMGIQEFANYADIAVRKKYPESRPYEWCSFFSNSVFVIDEVHTLTGENKMKTEQDTLEKEKKRDERNEELGDYKIIETDKIKHKRNVTKNGILTILHTIIEHATNIKFILLTATPMKDTKEELIDIINLLRANDGLELVKTRDIFPNDSDVNEKKLKESIRGYVSYVRGENPVSFPPITIKSDYFPKPLYDEYGNDFDKTKFIKYSNLYPAVMSVFQYTAYRAIIDSFKSKKQETKSEYTESIYSDSEHESSDDFDDDDLEGGARKKPTEERKNSDLAGRQAGNIIFPSFDGSIKYGNKGFNTIFTLNKHKTENKIGQKTVKKIESNYTINPDIEKKIIECFKYEENFKPSLNEKNCLGKYSSKLNKILHEMFNEENPINGLCFAYSDFKSCGAIILAIIFEINGYDKYVNQSGTKTNILEISQENRHLIVKRCKCGKLKDHKIHKNPNRPEISTNTSTNISTNNDNDKLYHPFKQSYYVLFTGDSDKNMNEEIDVINSGENTNTDLIKLIIGTRVSGTGIDYKRIRHMFIIEPWHNNTRLYQVIGRASRFCSHYDLQNSERNVTVYKLCGKAPTMKDLNVNKMTGKLTSNDLNKETSDEKIYRRIERKDIQTKKAERILKMSAIDCQINKNINHYPNDKNNSRECDYTDCEYKCEGIVKEDLDDSEINDDTYNIKFDESKIIYTQNIIFDLFRYNFVVDINGLISLIHLVDKFIPEYIINEAIERIVGYEPFYKPIKVYDQYNRSGHIIYKSTITKHPNTDTHTDTHTNTHTDNFSYYIFQPDYIKDDRAPLYYKMNPITLKRKFTEVDKSIQNDNTVMSLNSIDNKFIKQEKLTMKTIDIKDYYDIIMKNDLIENSVCNILRSFFKLPTNLQENIFEHLYLIQKDVLTIENIDKQRFNLIMEKLISFFRSYSLVFTLDDIDYHILYPNQKDNNNCVGLVYCKYYNESQRKWLPININSCQVIMNYMSNIRYNFNDIYAMYILDDNTIKFKILDKTKQNIQINAPKQYKQSDDKGKRTIIDITEIASERTLSKGRVAITCDLSYLTNLYAQLATVENTNKNVRDFKKEEEHNGRVVKKDEVCRLLENIFILNEINQYEKNQDDLSRIKHWIMLDNILYISKHKT